MFLCGGGRVVGGAWRGKWSWTRGRPGLGRAAGYGIGVSPGIELRWSCKDGRKAMKRRRLLFHAGNHKAGGIGPRRPWRREQAPARALIATLHWIARGPAPGARVVPFLDRLEGGR